MPPSIAMVALCSYSVVEVVDVELWPGHLSTCHDGNEYRARAVPITIHSGARCETTTASSAVCG